MSGELRSKFEAFTRKITPRNVKIVGALLVGAWLSAAGGASFERSQTPDPLEVIANDPNYIVQTAENERRLNTEKYNKETVYLQIMHGESAYETKQFWAVPKTFKGKVVFTKWDPGSPEDKLTIENPVMIAEQVGTLESPTFIPEYFASIDPYYANASGIQIIAMEGGDSYSTELIDEAGNVVDKDQLKTYHHEQYQNQYVSNEPFRMRSGPDGEPIFATDSGRVIGQLGRG